MNKVRIIQVHKIQDSDLFYLTDRRKVVVTPGASFGSAMCLEVGEEN